MALYVTLLSAGCASEASPEVRAGVWEGSTPFGDFAFFITADGTAIEDVDYSVHCEGNWTDDSSFLMGDPMPLDGRQLQFGVTLAGQVPIATWTGEFSADGTTLTGELSLFADSCNTEFEIAR
ncbi:MAG: hypothetical protein A2Z12_09075 [Actinobacteria bacterium RBG_16_68_21]|nr:MAG: hypothetical protein A2Z12_09075 [Actinobacteria bacterium RBG_16_68_21]